MNALTRELFTAAQCADRAAVERLLPDPRVDLLARDERGRRASECVSVGNVSMDPEDVAALRVWPLVITGEYRGALPSADPPLGPSELRVVLDEHTGLRELARVRWATT